MTVHRSDVVVIGAGPAGSATAIFLARSGYAVTLLDRAAFPRDKPCGEYLTPGAVSIIRNDIGVLPQMLAAGAVPLTHEIVVPHDGRVFGGATQALACPRTVTDQTLRAAASAAGVRVIENWAARGILWEDGQVAGVTNGFEECRAAVTVGADGTHSLLARTLGVVRPIRRLQRIALVGHWKTSPQSPSWEGQGFGSDTVTMSLPSDRSDACCGVGAPCGPDGTRNINIVVPVSEASKIAGRHEDYFRERLRRSFPRVWEATTAAERVGPLRSVGCFGHHTDLATHAGALLVGDAATFINPFTGEGVFFALRGAQIAAETIATALRQSDVSRRTLRRYDDARRRELLPRYQLCDWVQRVVHSPALLAWAAERLRHSVSLTDVLLQTIGDLGTPKGLFSLQTLRLAFNTG